MIIPFMYYFKWNGIDSISLNLDSVVEVIQRISELEEKIVSKKA